MILTFVYTTLKKLDINIWLFNLKEFLLCTQVHDFFSVYNRVRGVKRFIFQY